MHNNNNNNNNNLLTCLLKAEYYCFFFREKRAKLGCGCSTKGILARPKSSRANKEFSGAGTGSKVGTGTGSEVTAGMLAVPTGSASATGNPRNKVALTPGHSLLDWIKLGKSGKDLTGVGGRRLDVTAEELAKHCSHEDVWTAIKG